MTPFWISAFLDVPADRHDRSQEFWRAVTGTTVSPSRGEHDEFTTLVPPDGDDVVRVQRVGDGEPRVHLDLHVDDPRRAADELLGLGAEEVADRGYVVLRSPRGLPFCLVSAPHRVKPTAPTWPGGHRSAVDQVCLDVAPDAFEEELAFWAAVTGWPPTRGSRPEFANLRPPPEQPVQLLLQRRDEGDGSTSAHLDLGTSPGGRDPEVARHAGLGAEVVARLDHWTVLRDPVGLTYCVTDHPVR